MSIKTITTVLLASTILLSCAEETTKATGDADMFSDEDSTQPVEPDLADDQGEDQSDVQGSLPQGDCNAHWGLLTVDQGCRVVGPRYVEVDGVPSPLPSECPGGTTPSEDGSYCEPLFATCQPDEVPILGGDCHRVGAIDTPDSPPYFDKCPQYHLARQGGGCYPVGQRACPSVWGAEADCSPDELQPCPQGWKPSQDETFCEPVLAQCLLGEISLPGGQCEPATTPDDQCGAGPWPLLEEPGTFSDIIHVSKESSCDNNCGSADRPFSSIEEALESAVEGAAVLVGEGTYVEHLTISKPVTLVGLCPQRSIIVAPLPPPDEADQLPLVLVLGTADVSISGFGFAHGGEGVVIQDSQGVELFDLALYGEAGTALRLTGAEATANHLWITSVHPSQLPEEQLAPGVVVSGESTLAASFLLIEDRMGSGLMVQDEGSSLSLSSSLVGPTQMSSTANDGVGLDVSGGASAEISDCVFLGNHTAHARADGVGTHLSVHHTAMLDGKPNKDGLGRGVNCRSGASCVVTHTLVSGSHDAGLLAVNPQTKLSVSHSAVIDTVGTKEIPVAIYQGDSAQVLCSACTVKQREGDGVLSAGGTLGTASATHMVVEGLLVIGSGAQEAGTVIVGLFVGAGAISKATSSVFEHLSVGVAGIDKGSSIELTNITIRSINSIGIDGTGSGIQASKADLRLYDSLIEHCDISGIDLFDNSGVVLSSTVREINTDEDADLSYAHCLGASAAAHLEVTESLFEGCHGVSAAVMDNGSSLTLSSCTIRQGTPFDFDFSTGVRVENGGELIIENSLLERLRRASVLASGDGSSVVLRNSTVSCTLMASGLQAAGVAIQQGAQGLVVDSSLAGNEALSLLVNGVGSEATLENLLVEETLPGSGGGSGQGVEISQGAKTTASGLLVRGSFAEGVQVNAGASLTLTNSLVEDTRADSKGGYGRGVSVWGGSEAALDHLVITGSVEAGLMVNGAGTSVDVAWTIVEQTAPNPKTGSALGVGVEGQGTVSISDSWVLDNAGNGVLAHHEGTSVSLQRCVVGRTTETWHEVVGDHALGRGMTVHFGAAATIDATLFFDNFEVGINLSGQSGYLQLNNSIIRQTKQHEAGLGKGAFGIGLVVQEKALATVDHTLVTNNHSGGIGCYDLGTQVEFWGSTARETISSGVWFDPETGGPKMGIFGDGLYAVQGCELKVAGSIVESNDRAGVFADGSTLSVHDSAIFRNAAFGIAARNSVADVPALGNMVVQNCGDLLDTFCQDISYSVDDLGVPPAPSNSSSITH